MAVNIGPRIGIDGEKEYRDEINRIIQQGKTLKSEMDLVEASFDENTSAEEKAAKMAEVLSKRIETQKDLIKKYEDMLQRSIEKTGATSVETQKYQQKLNQAKTELLKLEKQTKQSGDETKNLGSTMKSEEKKVSSFGEVLKANLTSQAIVSGLQKIEEAAKKAVQTIVNVGKKLGKNFEETVQWADELKTLSTNTGLSTEALQEFEYMADLTDTDVETIRTTMARLIRSMSQADEKILGAAKSGEDLAAIEKEIADATEAVEEAQNAYNAAMKRSGAEASAAQKRASDALYEVEKAQIAYNKAVDAFGKDSAQAVAAGEALERVQKELSDAQAAYNRAAAEGTAAQNKLRKAQYDLASAESKLQAAQSKTEDGGNDVTTAFRALGIEVYDVNGQLRDNETVFGEVIDALGKMENETQRDAYAMEIFGRSAQELNSLIAVGAEKIADFKEEARKSGVIVSDEDLDRLSEVSDSLSRLRSNLSRFKKEFAAANADTINRLLESFAKNVLSKDATAETVKQFFDEAIPEVKNLFGNLRDFVKGLIKSSAPEILDTAVEIFNSLVEALGQGDTLRKIFDIVEKLIKNINKQIDKNGSKVVKTTLNLVFDIIKSILKESPEITKTVVEIVAMLIATIGENAPDLIDAVLKAIEGIVTTITQPDNLQKLIEAGLKLILGIVQGIVNGGPEIHDTIIDVLENILSLLTDPDFQDGVKEAGMALIWNLLKGAVLGMPGFGSTIRDLIKGELDFSKLAEDWGGDLILSFIDGIFSKWVKLEKALKLVGNLIKDILGFSEPKKGPLSNFHTYAPDMIDMFCQGLKDNGGKLEAQLQRTFGSLPQQSFTLGNVAMARPAYAGADEGGKAGGGTSQTINYDGVSINVYAQDGQSAREIAEEVLDILQTRITSAERNFA